MTELRRVDAPLPTIEQAKKKLDDWEAKYGPAVQIGLVMECKEDSVCSVVGVGSETCSARAGIFFMAAQMECE